MMMNDAGERFTHPSPRPVQVHFLPLALHEGYLLRQLAAPYSMAGTRTFFKKVCAATLSGVQGVSIS